jgi:hypothetical protein
MTKGAVALLVLAACGGNNSYSPSAPPAPPPANASTAVWGVIISEEGGGACIEGAKAEIVAGQGVGRSMVQITPCDWWDGPGFQFDGLAPGLELTVRATAAGYRAEEMTVVPTSPVLARLGFSLVRVE